jgi:hypothetical protein
VPTNQEVTVNIACDNPACPGHPDLKPDDRTGWVFVSHEVYGEPVMNHVFGSYDCLSQASGNTDTVDAWKEAQPPLISQEPIPDTPPTGEPA